MKKFWNWLMDVRMRDVLHLPLLIIMGVVLLPIIILVLIWDNICWKIDEIRNKRKNKK